MFVRFRKLKANENYNYKLRKNTRQVRKEMTTYVCVLTMLTMTAYGRLERIPHKKRIAVTLVRSSTYGFLLTLQST